MILVYFVYGLAFFSMGFAIALESRQSSGLKLAATLPFLAAFGLLHGMVEWMDMFLYMEANSPTVTDMDTVRLVRTVLLGVSTGALLQFGASLLSRDLQLLAPLGKVENGARGSRATLTERFVRSLISRLSGRIGWLRFMPLALGAAWIAVLGLLTPYYPLGGRLWFTHADVWARYMLYLPGSLLTGLGLYADARLLARADFRQVSRDARLAGATFLLNAIVAGMVVPPGQSLPYFPLSYDLFAAAFGVPAQLLRAGLALAMAFFMLRVLGIFRIESTRQMELANQRQLQAQQEALEVQKRAQAEMERWNRELEERIAQRTAEVTLRNRQLLAVNSIAASISQSFELEQILDQTLQQTLKALEADGGGIFLAGQDGEPSTRVVQGLPEEFADNVAQSRMNAAVVGRLSEPREASTALSASCEDSAPPNESRSFMTAPVRAKGRVVGVICVSRTRGQGFSAEEGRLLTAVGHQVGIAVENAYLFAQVQNMAALEERERIAREMHDGLAQVIGFLTIKTRVVQQLVSGGRLEQAEKDLVQMHEIVQEAYADVRQSILSLRTATELENGLIAAIRESAGDFTAHNSMPIELALLEEGEVCFPPEAEVQLVRIVQEALANVRKHARAAKAWIRMECEGGEAILTVEDDGVGFDPAQLSTGKRLSFGLQTMRERAESIGAGLEVISIPGEGTRVQVRFPIERPSREPRRKRPNTAG